MRLTTGVTAAVAAIVLAAPCASSAADDQRESFTATVVGGANMRLPGTGTFQIQMNVQQWTSIEERHRLLTVLKEGGKEALMKELRKLKAGYIVPPAFVRWPSWEIDVAASIDTAEGRIVRLFTERPIAFEEMYFNTRSRDFEFGVVELRLNEKGEGTGAVIPAASVSFNDEGQLVFETTPFATGPYKLIGVRQWRDKKKKD